ncbi:MAG: FkbM family methyltransferase [Terracidiphilus sp.]
MAVAQAKSRASSLALRKVEAAGGFSSRLHLFCLRAAAAASHLAGDRGMQRFTWGLARHFFSANNSAVLEMAAGGRLKIRLGDGYWTRLLIPGFRYEPEIWSPLSRVLREPEVFFLDCGANIGYWSVVSSQFLPPGRILAVEASPPNYEQLLENAKLNGDKFQAEWGALWERDGENVVIVSHELRHAGSSIVDRRDKIGMTGYRQHDVETVTIDTLCGRYVPDPEARIVIKLDVEGAEIPALRGARKTLGERQVMVLYEDHGHDPECRVSDFVMSELEFEVFHCSRNMKIRRMRSLADIRALKVDANAGYNFAAFSKGSPFSALFAES